MARWVLIRIIIPWLRLIFWLIYVFSPGLHLISWFIYYTSPGLLERKWDSLTSNLFLQLFPTINYNLKPCFAWSEATNAHHLFIPWWLVLFIWQEFVESFALSFPSYICSFLLVTIFSGQLYILILNTLTNNQVFII